MDKIGTVAVGGFTDLLGELSELVDSRLKERLGGRIPFVLVVETVRGVFFLVVWVLDWLAVQGFCK